MTHMEDNRCFGRLKARELTEEETALVGGGEDIYHVQYCPREMNGEGGQECTPIGCFYT